MPELGSIIAQAFEMANYEHTSYKTKPKNGWDTVEEILICGETPKDMVAGFARGQTIAKEVNTCRELCNTPGGDMTPKTLAKAAKAAILGTTTTVKVLGEKEIEASKYASRQSAKAGKQSMLGSIFGGLLGAL